MPEKAKAINQTVRIHDMSNLARQVSYKVPGLA